MRKFVNADSNNFEFENIHNLMMMRLELSLI